MPNDEFASHPIVSHDEWIAERTAFLAKEKEFTRLRDEHARERRALPWERVSKEYVFDGAKGKQTLAELFDGRSQLIVYHFMFDPAWDKGCPGCTGWVDSLGDLSLLDKKDTTFVVISRAPLAKLEGYKAEKGWSIPWFSSFGSDFNYDFHVTLDEKVLPPEANFRNKAETEAKKGHVVKMEGEQHGLSVLFQLDDDVFHTYSVYARGCESLSNAYRLLDQTPYGRQQDFEDSPPGWPQKPTYG